MEQKKEKDSSTEEHIDWYAVTINMLLGGALAAGFMMLGAWIALWLMK